MISNWSKVLISYLIVFFVMTPPAMAQSFNRSDLQSSSSSSSKSKRGKEGVSDLSNESELQLHPSMGGSSIGMGGASGLTQMINIHVLGDVSNPGVYKAFVSDHALDIVKRAMPNRDYFRVIQIRNEGRKTRYFDLYQYYYFGNLKHNPYLRDNDVIFVPKQKGAVRIEGPVARPGVFELNQEKNLSQIVKLAGGFTAAMSKMEPLKVIRYSDGGKKFVIDVVQTKSTMNKFKILRGDIVIVPDVINAGSKFDYTVESIPGENLVYPTAVPDVFVIGAVSSPGPYPFKSHLTVKDYLGHAGATENSKLSSVTILRNGKKRKFNLYSNVQQGDVIIVKRKSLDIFFKYLGIAATLMSFTISVIVFKDALKKQ